MIPDDRGSRESLSLQELVAVKKAELEAQLRALSTLDIEALLREREQTAVRLAELDEQIAQVRVQLGAQTSVAMHGRPAVGNDARASAVTGEAMRARMSSEEVNHRILAVLGEDQNGLSQLQIAERTALAYGTVAAYLKTNSERFRISGHLKGKRYFLA